MKGRLFGVGVGPGDPELMTYKAVRIIKECQVLAVPARDRKHAVSYRIAAEMIENMEEKEFLDLDTPMTKDRQILDRNYENAAGRIIEELEKGKDVAYLTLGDPTIYSTFTYVQKRVEADGYQTKLVSGITSFCATAARLNIPLTEWNQPLHVQPAVHRLDSELDQPGTYVLMKSGKKMNQVKEILARSGREVRMVENCGMPDEHIYNIVEEILDDAGYYSLIIAKEKAEEK